MPAIMSLMHKGPGQGVSTLASAGSSGLERPVQSGHPFALARTMPCSSHGATSFLAVRS